MYCLVAFEGALGGSSCHFSNTTLRPFASDGRLVCGGQSPSSVVSMDSHCCKFFAYQRREVCVDLFMGSG